MGSRFPGRLLVVALGLLRRLDRRPYEGGRDYRRILVAHHLLLGDTVLLTPLLAKLRQRYPQAGIWMTVPPAFVPLYEGRPYGVCVMPFSPRDTGTLRPWLDLGGFDLAFVPGDNRHAWLARALGARCIVALAGDGKRWKDWQVDRQVPWPSTAATLAEAFAALVDGPEPPPYAPAQWPAAALAELPPQPYGVLHLSARNPLRRWPAAYWREVAAALRQNGLRVVWSVAPGEAALLETVGPEATDERIAGTLSLPGLRGLLAGARLLVTVETGIAHLCRLTGTPSVVVFGQGNPALHGNEPFWRQASPMRPAFVSDVPCRDGQRLFGRLLPWVRRCDRSPQQCDRPVCIEAVSPEQVLSAAGPFIGH